MASIFALTVGIDKYLSTSPVIKNLPGRVEDNSPRPIFNNLSGCVADADDIVDLLTKTLHVPPGNITSLRNHEATAANIIAALELLATDSGIPKGAAIFIFYAGHGSEVSPPQEWSSYYNKIQTLIPYDFDVVSGPTNPVTKNELLDIKLGRLLEKIANAKGDNITVVFDSCHSGSGTRDFNSLDGDVARAVILPDGTTTGSLDADTLPPISREAQTETFKNKGLASHVLLAACTEQQKAYEAKGRGRFTSALTDLLRSADTTQLTYLDIIQRLPKLPNGQMPQCEGTNKHRIFLHVAERQPNFYKLTKHEKGHGTHFIDAGEAQGVTVNDKFTVYETCAHTGASLGILSVTETSPYRSFLGPIEGTEPFNIPHGAFVLQTSSASTKTGLLFNDPSDVLTDLHQLLATSTFQHSFKSVTKREEDPDLIVTAKDGMIRLEINDKICRDAGLDEIPYRLLSDIGILGSILPGIADFYWNLHRTTTSRNFISSGSAIELEFHELGYSDFDDMSDALQPTGANLIVNDIIHVDVGAEAKPYGFRINNKSNTPLFVSAFYFNMSDFSINSYYEPPQAGHNGHHLEPLLAKSDLTIGYGSSGTQPFTFTLKGGRDVDVGYIKLFFSTEYVDYSTVRQGSPFEKGRAVEPWKGFKRQLWNTKKISIVQHRSGTHKAGSSAVSDGHLPTHGT